MSMQEPCAVCGVVEWAHGVKYEQERIIKRIESYLLHHGKTHSASTKCHICEMIEYIQAEDEVDAETKNT